MQKRRKAEGNSFIRVPGGGGERGERGVGLAPPLSPGANDTTPSFPPRPKSSTPGPSPAPSRTLRVHASLAARAFSPRAELRWRRSQRGRL